MGRLRIRRILRCRRPTPDFTALWEQLKVAIQALLADRFKLKFHREQRIANLLAGSGKERAEADKEHRRSGT